MTQKSDLRKTASPFDKIVFHWSWRGEQYSTEWDYAQEACAELGIEANPRAGDGVIEDSRALGAIIWPLGRTVFIFMAQETHA